MKIHVIETGLFKLDGGAMFGVVPKTMWQKLNPPDDNNLCTWAMRCLLVQTPDGRNVLIDTGMGDKQDEKFRSHFHPHGTDTLLHSLSAVGVSPDDITDVFLTHLHFDHAGGAVKRAENGELLPTFQKAKYWCNQAHYDWAYTPNPREAASFLRENFEPLHQHGVIEFITPDANAQPVQGIGVRWCYGHTEALMAPEIHLPDGRKVIFCADLLPSENHIGLPYVMAYDVRPLVTMTEKEALLTEAAEQGHILFFEHSPTAQCATVKRDERGRFVTEKRGNLIDLM